MKLVIFFNGWGMDSNILKKSFQNVDYEILYINYPYNVPSIDFTLYKNIYIVAWSFGVYYANKFLKLNKEFQKFKSIAINGTPELIGKYGISSKMINFTLNNLDEISLEKFYKNMGNLDNFNKPIKSINDLKDELKFFIDNYTPIDNYFKYSILSKNDKIINTENQKCYWNKKEILMKEVESGHFPFLTEDDIFNYIRMFENEV